MTPSASLLGYFINLDERGDFYADVRDPSGSTIFEVRADDDGTIDLIEDGFMRDRSDLAGLSQHLRDLGIIAPDAEILTMRDFEARLEDSAAEPEF